MTQQSTLQPRTTYVRQSDIEHRLNSFPTLYDLIQTRSPITKKGSVRLLNHARNDQTRTDRMNTRAAHIREHRTSNRVTSLYFARSRFNLRIALVYYGHGASNCYFHWRNSAYTAKDRTCGAGFTQDRPRWQLIFLLLMGWWLGCWF
jgi:hypothetical protein